MNSLYFIGMDIAEETKSIVSSAESKITNGMKESELKAYRLGVANTISVLKAILEPSIENEFVLNINGIETPTEFDNDELMDRLQSFLMW